MKKLRLKIVFMFSVVLVVSSCNQERIDNAEKSLDLQKHVTKSTSSKLKNRELDTFVSDELMRKLVAKSSDYKEAISKKDLKKMVALSKDIKYLSNQLFKKYGENTFFKNLDALIENERSLEKIDGSHDNDPCTRNLNGSLYFDQCSMWENVKVYVTTVFTCPSPPDDLIIVNPSMYNELLDKQFDCIQSKICAICS